MLSRTDAATRLVQAASLAAGALLNAFASKPAMALAGLTLLIVAAGWTAASYFVRKRRSIPMPETAAVRSSYLRSLLPFERGERLLGREHEVRQLLAKIRSLEFRAGFISGEAGSGKTSLLRARLVGALEEDGKKVIYIARTGQDPIGNIRKSFSQHFVLESGPSGGISLRELIQTHSVCSPDRPLIVIIDQFEEYFIAPCTARHRKKTEDAFKDLMNDDLGIRLLISIRKDFVADLLELSRVIPALSNTACGMLLHNLTNDTARAILRHITEDEALPFPVRLQEAVIADLTRQGYVRPVEFQIVLSTLLAHNINDLQAYRARRGVTGVLSGFVAEIIETDSDSTEATVAKHVLRALCNDTFTGKRPEGGLTQADLLTHVLGQLQQTAEGRISRASAKKCLDRVLIRLTQHALVVVDTDKRFNLVHDYLAVCVRTAINTIDSLQERAHRILTQYIEQDRAGIPVQISWKTLRFIRRFASPDSLKHGEAVSLLRRASRRIWVAGASLCAVGLLVLSLLTSFGPQYRQVEQLTSTGEKVVSPSNSLIVTLLNGKADLIKLDEARMKTHTIALKTKSALIAPLGDVIFLLGVDSDVYRLDVRDPDNPVRIISKLDPPDQFDSGRIGFSPDWKSAYYLARTGTVYIWPTKSVPRELFTVAGIGKSGSVPAGFSENSKWFWLHSEPENRIYIASTADKIQNRPRIVNVYGKGLNFAPGYEGKRLAYLDNEGKPAVIDFVRSSEPFVASVPGFTSPLAPTRFQLSEDENWLFVCNADRSYLLDVARVTESSILTERQPIWNREFFPLAQSSDGNFIAGQDTPNSQFLLRKTKGTYVKYDSPRRENNIPYLNYFAKDNESYLQGTYDGAIYRVRLTTFPPRYEKLLQLSGSFVFRETADPKMIYLFDSEKIYGGTFDRVDPIYTAKAGDKILEITGGGKVGLIVITQNRIVRLARDFHIAALPLVPIAIPRIPTPQANLGTVTPAE